MASRSLTAQPPGIEQAERALTDRAWSREDLMTRVQLSRKTINKFFNGKPIDRKNFVRICQTLELEWSQIAGLPSEPFPQNSSPQNSSPQNHAPQNHAAQNNSPQTTDEIDAQIDDQVEQARQQVRAYIHSCCGTMRVLDMSYPLELSDIYTRVNILEKITALQQLEATLLLPIQP